MIHLKNQERLINKLFSSEKFLATVIYRYASTQELDSLIKISKIIHKNEINLKDSTVQIGLKKLNLFLEEKNTK